MFCKKHLLVFLLKVGLKDLSFCYTPFIHHNGICYVCNYNIPLHHVSPLIRSCSSELVVMHEKWGTLNREHGHTHQGYRRGSYLSPPPSQNFESKFCHINLWNFQLVKMQKDCSYAPCRHKAQKVATWANMGSTFVFIFVFIH